MTTTLNLEAPSQIQSLTWQPYRREDIPAVYELLLAVDEADGTNAAATLDEQYREYEDPWLNPEEDSLLALTAEGRAVALARVFMNPQPKGGERRAFLFGSVHPEFRVRELEEFILTWMERRGRERLRQDEHQGTSRLLRTFTPQKRTDWIQMLEQHGFQLVRRSYRMRRDLSEPIPQLELPEGLTLRTYAPEFERAMMDAFNETFIDHWGFEPVADEDWQIFFIQRSGFRPDLSFLALAGDELAGFSYNRVSPEENEREGIQQGWISDLGVRRPWRKRGVASALICASMRAFKAEGLDYATLGVDTENLTGALRIYERLGFVPVQHFVTFDKTVE